MEFRMFHFNKILLVLVSASVLLFSACSKTPQVPLRLGTNVWAGYEPLYLARSLGELKPDKVRLIEYVSATQVMRGLIDGAIDVAALTLDEAILVQQQGVDVRVILVMDYSAGADALVSQPTIKKLKDLRGKRVGVETTALGAYMMHRVLEKGNLKLSDIKLVPLDFSQHEQAYRSGSVDAVVTFDPLRSRLLEAGAISLLDSSQLPGEIVDVLVIKASAIPQNMAKVDYLLTAWFKSIDYIKTKPRHAARSMMPRLKLDEAGIRKSLQDMKFPGQSENKKLLASEEIILAKQARRLAEVMLVNNLLAVEVEADNLFDKDLLQELYK